MNNNRYLQDRASRRGGRGMDGRNPYGSRGGYVVSSRGRGRGRGRDRADMDYAMDYARGRGRDRGIGMDYEGQDYGRGDYASNDYARGNQGGRSGRDGHYPMAYEMYGYTQPMMDYRGGDYGMGMDYGYDYGYDYASEDKEWKEHLKKWSEKLKKKDRFGWEMQQVIQHAKQMGVEFEEYDEMEFYTTYLMVMSDYPKVANEPHTYLAMAKEWLEDKDAEMKGSEKLCAYYYEIVKGGKE